MDKELKDIEKSVNCTHKNSEDTFQAYRLAELSRRMGKTTDVEKNPSYHGYPLDLSAIRETAAATKTHLAIASIAPQVMTNYIFIKEKILKLG